MASPRISVVTPSYNQREFIRDTLESVRRQSYPNVEHLVIDGESTDGTVELLEEYEGDYPLSWWSEPDEGQSDAINKGFERASGEIVAWLNSDDVYFDVDVLARVKEHFRRSDADIIYGDLAYLGTDSTVTAVDVRPPFDRAKLPYRILIGQPATFFRREVVEDEKLRTDLRFSMDYEYWLRLARNYEFEHVTDVLAGFRSYEAQKSQDQEAMAAELEDVFDQYPYPEPEPLSVLLDNARIETERLLRAAVTTVRLHRDTPELAFDGELAPLSVMLRNLGPGWADVTKAWRRWRTDSA